MPLLGPLILLFWMLMVVKLLFQILALVGFTRLLTLEPITTDDHDIILGELELAIAPCRQDRAKNTSLTAKRKGHVSIKDAFTRILRAKDFNSYAEG
jgi:hypothetical protein